MRTCTKCGDTKPLDQYHRNKPSRGGRLGKCKTCIATYSADYYAENRESVLARRSEYRNQPEVKEQKAEYNREYYAENPHVTWESRVRGLAKHYGFTPVIESFTKDELIARWGSTCFHCGGPFEQLDHYPIPLSKGGHHVIENARPSCADCNSKSWKPEFNTNETSN